MNLSKKKKRRRQRISDYPSCKPKCRTNWNNMGWTVKFYFNLPFSGKNGGSLLFPFTGEYLRRFKRHNLCRLTDVKNKRDRTRTGPIPTALSKPHVGWKVWLFRECYGDLIWIQFCYTSFPYDFFSKCHTTTKMYSPPLKGYVALC